LKVNPEKLQQSLRLAILEINKRPNHVEKTLKEMALNMFNMTGGEIAYILNGRTPVDTMSEDTLYKVTKILHEYLVNHSEDFDVTQIDVTKYFTDTEQKNYKKKIDRKVIDSDIVREYYVPIADDQIIISFTNKELTQLAAMNKIHYEPETQRSLTTIETANGSIQKVTINPEAYNSIFEDMKADDYIPNMLTFNADPDSSEQPRIVDNKVIIPQGCIINCIDGYHRFKVLIAVTKLNPDWNITIPVMFVGFDVKKAKRFIIQEDKKTHLTKEQTTEDNQDDAANFIIGKFKNSNYLKDSGVQNISYQLNRIINGIFSLEPLKTSEARQKALTLFKRIEEEMDTLIEDNMWIGKEFSKEEWFMCLYLMNYCWSINVSFQDYIKKINSKELLELISITNEPSPKQYKIMKEAIKNV
jgi:hypothetical protein